MWAIHMLFLFSPWRRRRPSRARNKYSIVEAIAQPKFVEVGRERETKTVLLGHSAAIEVGRERETRRVLLGKDRREREREHATQLRKLRIMDNKIIVKRSDARMLDVKWRLLQWEEVARRAIATRL